jgi:alkanesulfonate monooxygenase SsuD/methylene tetrahydromethanopterin reductase-like flavin-dependent oxidoreductase (luciferase family)
MRVGIVILPEYRWWVARPKWQAVDTYGFDHAWTYDHLGWRSLVDGPWFGALPTLTAAAMVTERVRLGTFVASPNFRHPVPLVRELTAIDDVSDGRLVFGAGAGTTAFDAEVLGQEPLTARARVDRFAEFLELLDATLTADRTTWRGEYYTAVQARSAPRSVQTPRVPFVVAGNGPRTIGLATRFGQGWVTTGKPGAADWWTGVAELVGRLEDTLAEQGRPADALSRYLSLDAGPNYSLSSVECFTDAAGRAAELGFTDVVAHWPRSDGVYAGRETVLERVAEDVLPGLQQPRSGD